MIRFYDSNYNYLRLKFLNEAINPQCELFSMEKTQKCSTCEYKMVCRDLRSLLARLDALSEKNKNKKTRKYTKHKI